MDSTSTIWVSIVEEKPLLISSVTKIIDASEGFEVLRSYTNAEEAIEDLRVNNPDVLLLDIDLPDLSSMDAIPKIIKNNPDLNIIILSGNEELQTVFSSLEKGALGYLLKTNQPRNILDGIVEVYGGGSPMSPSIARQIITSFRSDINTHFTERELQVLQQLGNGYNNKKIAAGLFVSTNTVKAHIKNIYKKMKVHSRAEAVSKAIKKRLI